MKDFEQVKERPHFAETLILGDRIKATKRHKIDGSKNITKADMIFLECNHKKRTIKAVYKNKVLNIDFCEIEH